MGNEELRAKLTSLHEQLSTATEVDGRSRELLRTLLLDIERLLDQPATGSGLPAAEAHEHRLEELATRFEAGHPAIAGVLRQLIDSLGKAGL
jgi:hypothetical protein